MRQARLRLDLWTRRRAESLSARRASPHSLHSVYVGWLERERYGDGGLAKFADFLDGVFQKREVTIYRVSEPTEGSALAGSLRRSPTRKS